MKTANPPMAMDGTARHGGLVLLTACLVAVFSLVAVLDRPLIAQSASSSSAGSSLDAIDIQATNRRDELQSTTAVVVDGTEHSRKVIQTPLEVIRQVPGISAVGYNEGGVPWEIKIRGFNGGHFSGVSFTLDGVPLNGPNGNFDANFINPMDIETVEVVKGPSSVYFGLNAMGGSIAWSSIKRGDFTRFQARYGSYHDAQATGVVARTIGRFDHVYSFQLQHTDGWRSNSGGEKGNVSAQVSFRPNDKLTVGLNLRAYTYNWDQAGFLWSEESVGDQTAYNDDNGGKSSRLFARLYADYLLSENSLLSVHAFYTKLDFTRYQRAYLNLLWGNGNENNTQTGNFGLRAVWSWRGLAAGRDLALTLGAEWRREDQRFIQWNFLPGSGRARGAIAAGNKWNNVVTALSLFGEANYQILEVLKIRAGLRYDSYDGERDVLAAVNGPMNHFNAKGRDAFSPKAGLLFTPISGLELFFNYGKTYDLPALASGEFFTSPNAEMPQSRQFEGGIKWEPIDWLSLGAAWFDIETKNDLSTNVITQRLENIGKTSRQGIELSAQMALPSGFRASANYTWQDVVYKDTSLTQTISPNTVIFDVSGRRLNDVPKEIFNAMVAYEPETGPTGSLSFWWYGPTIRNDWPEAALIALNKPDYSLKRPATYSLDLNLGWKFNDTYRVALDVMNLTDKRNIGFAAPTPLTARRGYVYSLQMPRTFYLSLEANWK